MRTISQAVEEIIERSPFLAEVLESDVGSHARIARKIRPAVEKRLYENVTEASIVMALRRRTARYRSSASGSSFLQQLNDITVRSNLVAFVFPNLASPEPLWDVLLHKSKRNGDHFVNFTCGLHESLVVAHTDMRSYIEPLLKGKRVKMIDGLSALTLRLPEESLEVPGVYYPILRAIASENVSFIEVMSVGTELSILFRDTDIDRAFSILKKITAPGP
ncbi:MAG: hypothetical protein V4480_01175 [Patescibacteria group bacterium]